MSVVIRREHPSGEVGLSVDVFPENETVVLGMGPLREMKFFSLNAAEADEVAVALLNSTDEIYQD